MLRSMLATLRLLAQKQSAREMKRDWSELTTNEEISHGVEIESMESAEEEVGATHIVADVLILCLIQGVEIGDTI